MTEKHKTTIDGNKGHTFDPGQHHSPVVRPGMIPLVCVALLLQLVPFFACENKSNSIYENCCGTAAVTDSVLLDISNLPDSSTLFGAVYIPNIFVPDTSFSSGTLNPVFMVFGNAGTDLVLSQKITDDNGTELYARYDFPPNDVGFGWTGVKPDDSVHYGGFNYEVKVRFADGHEKTYTGKACAFKCEDSDFPNEQLPDCLFPEQHNGNGAPDPGLPQPSDCF